MVKAIVEALAGFAMWAAVGGLIGGLLGIMVGYFKMKLYIEMFCS